MIRAAHHATVRVVDDHDLLGAHQIGRDDRRPQHILRHTPPRVAKNMRLPRLKAQCCFDVDASIHAGDHHEVPSRRGVQVTIMKPLAEDFVVLECLVDGVCPRMWYLRACIIEVLGPKQWDGP